MACRKEPVLKEQMKIQERGELIEDTRYLVAGEARERGWDGTPSAEHMWPGAEERAALPPRGSPRTVVTEVEEETGQGVQLIVLRLLMS